MKDVDTSNASSSRAGRGVPSGRRYSRWLAAGLLVVAVGLILSGSMAKYRLSGDDQPAISEPELVQAITVGGVEPASSDATTQPGASLKVKKTKDQDFCPT